MPSNEGPQFLSTYVESAAHAGRRQGSVAYPPPHRARWYPQASGDLPQWQQLWQPGLEPQIPRHCP